MFEDINQDHIDTILAQWRNVRPECDASPMGIFTRILRLAHHLEQRSTGLFRRHGLHMGEFDLLATLYRCGQPVGLTPDALRRDLALSSGAMTHRIDRLEGAGLVERVPNPDDRRSVLIRLLDAGEQVLLAALDDYLEMLHGMQGPLDDQCKAEVAAGLRTVLLLMESQDA